MKYQSFYKMMKKLTDFDFLKKYYTVLFVKNTCDVESYQDLFRFYLDEYKEQKLLREAWFQNRENEYFVLDIIKYGNEKSSTVNDNKTYFFNRWMKRN